MDHTPKSKDLTSYLHAIWYTIFQITLALYFLFQQLGVSCLGGVAVMIVMMPATKFVAKWMGRQQKQVMKAKDERVEINSEVLTHIKGIKTQAWEESFQSRILRYRQAELDQMKRYYIGNAASTMLWNGTPVAVAVATFSAYVLSGHQLEVASALTSLALFDILRFPLFMLPQSEFFFCVFFCLVVCCASLNKIWCLTMLFSLQLSIQWSKRGFP